MLVNEFYHSKVSITLEQDSSEHYLVVKKEESYLAKLRCSGVVNFHFMQIAPVMSIRFIFSDD